jgi:hypothetical protein
MVKIDFMFVDLQARTRCRGTDVNLATALDMVRSLLEAAGVEILVKKDIGRFRAKVYGTGPCLVADNSG